MVFSAKWTMKHLLLKIFAMTLLASCTNGFTTDERKIIYGGEKEIMRVLNIANEQGYWTRQSTDLLPSSKIWSIKRSSHTCRDNKSIDIQLCESQVVGKQKSELVPKSCPASNVFTTDTPLHLHRRWVCLICQRYKFKIHISKVNQFTIKSLLQHSHTLSNFLTFLGAQ